MAASKENTEYVCTLSDDLIKQAEEELNEKPQWRSRDVQALRDMLEKKPGLWTEILYLGYLALKEPD